MADNASCLFDLSGTPFISYMSITYLQSHILWQLCPLPPQLFSCMIYTLRRKPCKQGLHMMRTNRDSTGSAPISTPTCRSDLLSKIHPSLELKSCRYMDTGSDMPSNTSAEWTNLGKSWFLRHGGNCGNPPPVWPP